MSLRDDIGLSGEAERTRLEHCFAVDLLNGRTLGKYTEAKIHLELVPLGRAGDPGAEDARIRAKV